MLVSNCSIFVPLGKTGPQGRRYPTVKLTLLCPGLSLSQPLWFRLVCFQWAKGQAGLTPNAAILCKLLQTQEYCVQLWDNVPLDDKETQWVRLCCKQCEQVVTGSSKEDSDQKSPCGHRRVLGAGGIQPDAGLGCQLVPSRYPRAQGVK